ncbi:MAG: LLM class flavin-dependent oxidoreductase [Pseudomonadota bacterium]|jgi:alkanesulfonate monooxygenase SsuD/methylene tetrahydromethanopterin reductase-like flavin-dependent oxidoreductase (luciferase family)|nr:LLM class flavin-dependent oxidoreductase [Pseudomonadota bacterium]
MNLGLFMMPLHPPEKDRTQSFDEDAECVIWADQLGFKEVWVGQHHTAGWEPIPSNDLFIAHMLPQTRNIRFGTGVSIITQHHPANVAVRLAYLDHLSRGRLSCGFGQGGVPTDWSLFDLPDPGTQGLMTLEAMDIILKLWQADEPFEFNGDYWNVTLKEKIPELALGEMLKPYQRPHPPIAMSIVREKSMAAKTGGERGFIPISINLAPSHKVKTQWDTYSEGATGAGHSADRSNWRISRSIYVGESDDAARSHALNSAFADSLVYLKGMLSLAGMQDLMKEDVDMPDDAVDAEYLIDNIAIVGSVDTVTTKLHKLYEQTGGFGNLLMIAHDWDDRDKMRQSMKLMAEDVVPQLP